MSRWSQPSVRLGKLPLFALLSAVVLLAVGAVTIFYQDQIYRAQSVDAVRAQGEILASGVSAALFFNDGRAAREYTNALRANPSLDAVGVYPLTGPAIAGFVQRGSPLPPTARPRAPFVASDKLIVTLPVVQKGTPIGTVYLRATTEPLQRKVARYAGIFLLVTMAALVLLVLASSQVSLSRTNAQLQSHASALIEANERLRVEMEERSKVEAALRQSQKMEAVGQLSGGIAHDFNNLIMIVKGNLHLLGRRLGQGRTDVQRYLGAATEGLNRAATLTQRILAFSRRQPLTPQPVDLMVLVEGMADLIRHSLKDRARMELRLQSNWLVVCDANQMESTILNLVINARDAMPDGGEVTISTENIRNDSKLPGFEDAAAGDYVRLTVADTGIGMTDDVRAKAIDPFFTTKPIGQGTGLGLSMAFGYVRQSGGHMAIESAPGKGTSIIVLMPRMAADPGAGK